MAHVIIGTAGHVDHGKTSLIKALTNVDTDRLKEEKERGITIQLGFAYFDLPNGKRAGIIDVPGHEKFVRNMLAGIGGIDVVLLVVAADEGVMPQTKEHLNILRLLDVKRGIIVITKKDMVDEELLDLVKEDVLDNVKNSFLEKAEIVSVSSTTGEGIEDLKREIIKSTKEVEERESKDFFRLPIDRVFTLKGFGTIVTGTSKDGIISVGDSCILYPSQKEVKVRQIQVHGEKVARVYPGQRTAINITGVEKEEVTMGDLLTTADYLAPRNKINCVLNLLEDVPELENGTMVRFHWGTEETYGRAVLLDRDVLRPGEKCFCQIRLEAPVVVARNDHFVLRSMSPVETIGGGIILSSTNKRVSRYNKEVIESFSIKENGKPEEIILEGLREYSFNGISKEDFAVAYQIDLKTINETLEKLVREDRVIEIKGEGLPIFIEQTAYQQLVSKINEILTKYHDLYPLRQGMDKEELRSKLEGDYSVKFFTSILKQMNTDALIKVEGSVVSNTNFQINLSDTDMKKIEVVLSTIKESGFKPPSKGEISLEPNLLQYLAQQGKIVLLGDMVLSREVLEDGIQRVIKVIKDKPKGAALSDIKDVLNTSRKYLVPLLEYLDSEAITKRVGEVRILGNKGKEMV